ncbi:MAG: hypothetical protein AAB487_00330 [Patescibacteria group bacterium]
MSKAETVAVRGLSKVKLAKFKRILERNKKIAMEELAESTGEVNDLLKRCGIKTSDPSDKLEPPTKKIGCSGADPKSWKIYTGRCIASKQEYTAFAESAAALLKKSG